MGMVLEFQHPPTSPSTSPTTPKKNWGGVGEREKPGEKRREREKQGERREEKRSNGAFLPVARATHHNAKRTTPTLGAVFPPPPATPFSPPPQPRSPRRQTTPNSLISLSNKAFPTFGTTIKRLEERMLLFLCSLDIYYILSH